jgi:hypothetical protein
MEEATIETACSFKAAGERPFIELKSIGVENPGSFALALKMVPATAFPCVCQQSS